MADWYAHWTGKWPSLCYGEWQLFKNEVRQHVRIPFNDYEDVDYENKEAYTEQELEDGFRLVRGMGSPANTYREDWSHCALSRDYDELYSTYEDGLKREEWCREYEGFLLEVDPRAEDWGKIYRAFRAEDFRPNSCGGCL